MIDKVTTTVINTKIIEIENKILEITNLATKAALNIKATGIENEIPDTSHFINTQAFNRLKTKKKTDARMKEAEKNLRVVSTALDLGDKSKKKTSAV